MCWQVLCSCVWCVSRFWEAVCGVSAGIVKLCVVCWQVFCCCVFLAFCFLALCNCVFVLFGIVKQCVVWFAGIVCVVMCLVLWFDLGLIKQQVFHFPCAILSHSTKRNSSNTVLRQIEIIIIHYRYIINHIIDTDDLVSISKKTNDYNLIVVTDPYPYRKKISLWILMSVCLVGRLVGWSVCPNFPKRLGSNSCLLLAENLLLFL